VQSTAWSKGLRVTADGSGVVSHVGAVLLRMLADRTGLTQAVSGALTRRGWWPAHDRSRVVVDLAVMIAGGGEAICDIDVLRDQGELFGPVASAATCWRALDEIGDVQLRRIAKARARARARVWALLGAVPPARAAGRDVGDGVVVLDIDSTIVLAHSEKEGAPTYKSMFVRHEASGASPFAPDAPLERLHCHRHERMSTFMIAVTLRGARLGADEGASRVPQTLDDAFEASN